MSQILQKKVWDDILQKPHNEAIYYLDILFCFAINCNGNTAVMLTFKLLFSVRRYELRIPSSQPEC